MHKTSLTKIHQSLLSAAEKRILLIDGAMGTMIQQESLQEDDFTGKNSNTQINQSVTKKINEAIAKHLF